MTDSDEYERPPATARELTPRELAVASLVARKYLDKRIACELSISVRTVRVYIAAIAYKIHTPADCNVRVDIADWWRSQTPELKHVA